jgi:acyl transferase domain-containing protein
MIHPDDFGDCTPPASTPAATAIAPGLPSQVAGEHEAGARRRIVLAFSGEGAHWPGMGCALFACEPVFRAALEEFDAELRSVAGWSVLDALRAPSASRLDDTAVAQPAIVGVQLALAALWRSWGVAADAVVGHGVGEIAAACVAGALDVAQAARVAFHRGRVMQPATGRGRMVAVALPLEAAEELAARRPDTVSVAVHDGPTLSVLAGDVAPLQALVASLEARSVGCRWLAVDYAFHSHQMEPFCAELTESLGDLAPGSPSIPIVSSVRGAVLDGGSCDAAYWARNMRARVRFAEAVGVLLREGHEVFLEIGGHPVLVGAVRQTLRAAGRAGAIVVASLRRAEPERASLLASLGCLCAGGWTVAPFLRDDRPGETAAVPAAGFPNRGPGGATEAFGPEDGPPATPGRGQLQALRSLPPVSPLARGGEDRRRTPRGRGPIAAPPHSARGRPP